MQTASLPPPGSYQLNNALTHNINFPHQLDRHHLASNPPTSRTNSSPSTPGMRTPRGTSLSRAGTSVAAGGPGAGGGMNSGGGTGGAVVMAGSGLHVPPVFVKKVSLTSKKNWWLVEMDEETEQQSAQQHYQHPPVNTTAASFTSSEETVAPSSVNHTHSYHQHTYTHAHHPPHTPSTVSQPFADIDPGSPSPKSSPPESTRIFHPPDRTPAAIFQFPTPTSYAAPPNPTSQLAPIAYGSTSELFKCIVKKPEVVQLEINGEMQSNATDVTTQFLAELRLYTTVASHRNIVAFLGCLEGVGMVLEYVDGRTLLDVVRAKPPLEKPRKIDLHNQLVDGLSHIHSYGLSHGDLSLLNVYVTNSGDAVKILDFGRSVAADSFFDSPSNEPADPFAGLRASLAHSHSHNRVPKKRKVEQIHLGTRPFTAPEIIRGECQDAMLADAYSLGVILVCIDQCQLVDCDPQIQRQDIIPPHFLKGCDTFGERIQLYLKPWAERRRVMREDMMKQKSWLDDDDDWCMG